MMNGLKSARIGAAAVIGVLIIVKLLANSIVGERYTVEAKSPTTSVEMDAPRENHLQYELPGGYRFMYTISASDAISIRSAKPGQNIYVAYEENVPQRYQTKPTRTIHFLQTGDERGTWREVVTIYER